MVYEPELDGYFARFGRVDLLSAEQEVDLAKRIASGREARRRLDAGVEDPGGVLAGVVRDGERAFDAFVEANLRLVIGVAAKVAKRSGLDLADLVQDGNVGLLAAVERYDWRTGYRFSTYGLWWIRQAVQRGCVVQESAIRLPFALHEGLLRVRAATNRLEAETGRTPTVDELAEATKLPRAEVLRVQGHALSLVPLEQKVGHDSGADELGDFLPAPIDVAQEVVDRAALHTVVATARELLDERAWAVLVQRYGLDGSEPRTLAEIGASLGVSRETVRLTTTRALAQLRETLGEQAAA
jgi:RNA polymerase primary sigma factor